MCLGNYLHYRQSVRFSVRDNIKMSIVFKLATFRNAVMLKMHNEKKEEDSRRLQEDEMRLVQIKCPDI